MMGSAVISPTNRMNLSASQTMVPPKPEHESLEKSGRKPTETHSSSIAKSMFISPESKPKKKEEKPAPDDLRLEQFYFPRGRPVDSATEAENKALLDSLFKGLEADYPTFREVFKQVMGLPSYFARLVNRKLGKTNETAGVNRAQFIKLFKSEFQNKTPERRAFMLLQSNPVGVVPDDFKPILRDIMEFHDSLEFLKATPQFQDKYSDTVTLRIFFKVNLKDDGLITWREFKRSNLIETLAQLELQPDNNAARDYFSYSDFYVIFCKFWDVDTHKTGLLSREDFEKYNSHGLSRRTVERIYQQVPRKFTKDDSRMCYADFVYFILCEEDKSTPQSLEYWFRILDLDGNGKVAGYELEYFYEEQSQRLTHLNKEVSLSFENLLCEMVDLVKPRQELVFTLDDFLRQPTSGNFISILTNINKLLAFESRDPHQYRTELNEHPEYTEWDRFSKTEYQRLEESTQNEGEQMEITDDL